MDQNWREYFEDNKGKLVGAVLGFLVGLLIIAVGFFKAFFVIICTFFGFYLGMKRDDREDIFKVLERFIPRGSSRR